MDFKSKVDNSKSLYAVLFDSYGREVFASTFEDFYIQNAPSVLDCENEKTHLMINLEDADISYDSEMDFYEISLEGMQYQIWLYE